MTSGIKAVSPEEAARLLEQGATYVDVRSEPEFEQGHVPGALNVPLLHQAPGGGMQENTEFLTVMQTAFAKHEKLVIGCKSGGRSRRAATLLVQAGFEDIADLVSGFEGGRDAFGRPLPGWSKKDLPIETGRSAGQTYADVKQREAPKQ
jgi:rhodanese-related sulfurtransferase